ncbi:MAG: DUF4153 domain-containing protein [Gammaproteobacteria bacterium]|nr:DUF4153 domain-containing protein [Gammaproteobacteria bacterium]
MWVLIAIQALVLAGIGVLLDLDLWPSGSPAVLLPTLTVAYAWPTVSLFTSEPGIVRRGIAFGGASAVVLAGLASYVGWQAMPVGQFDVEALQAVYVITLLVTGFIALAYLKLIVAGEPIRYPALFAHAWRNLLVAALAAALLGGSAILLVLWAALFATLGVDVLAETFQKPWFVLPAAAVAFGTGVLVFRPRQRLIDSIVGLLENLARYLLPMVLAIIVVFLLTLPFVSLQALWDTGNGSLILIALNAIAVVLAIVAHRPEAEQPYPALVQAPVTLAIAFLPIVSALALLGIGIRVDQYGWTVARAWAFTGAAVLALFSLGYTWSIVRHRRNWPDGMARVNVAMGWVMLAILLLINTPVLDFRAISTRSQIARVESGEIQPIEFDFRYAGAMLARPGYFAAQRLIEQLGFDPLADGAPKGLVMRRADDAVDAGMAALRDEFWAEVYYRDGPFAVPDGVRNAIDGVLHPSDRIEHPTLARVELDGDSTLPEYLLLAVRRFDVPAIQDRPARMHYSPTAYAIVDEGQGWELVGLSRSSGQLPADAESLAEILRDAPIERLAPRYDDFRIGEALFGFPPRFGRSEDAIAD